MGKIGIVGGLSPESTVSYYLHICRRYTQLYGNVEFPEIVIYSVCLEKYHQWRNSNRWDLIVNDLVKAINYLEKAGADFAVIATNTMHKVLKEIKRETKLPIISIIDATIEQIKIKKIKTVGLIGTRFTMRDDFFSGELINNGINVLTPDDEGVTMIHGIIENELVKGIINNESRRMYQKELKKLIAQGAEGIILGCTEIPLLIKQEACEIPVFDTAVIHAEKALQYSLENSF